MANMCYTSVTLDGDREKLKEIANNLEELGNELGFEELFEKFGKEPDEDYSLRGWIEDWYFDEDSENPHITLGIESAWGIDEELLFDLFSRYNEDKGEYDVNVYYSFWIERYIGFGTNDFNKKYYKSRYFIYDPDEEVTGDYMNWYETKEEAYNHLKHLLPDLTIDELDNDEDVNIRLRNLELVTDPEFHSYKLI